MCKNCSCKTKALPGFYLLTIQGDTDPSLSLFPSAQERDQAAKAHRSSDLDKSDSLYKVDMIEGVPQVSSYSGADLDSEGSNEEA